MRNTEQRELATLSSLYLGKATHPLFWITLHFRQTDPAQRSLTARQLLCFVEHFERSPEHFHFFQGPTVANMGIVGN